MSETSIPTSAELHGARDLLRAGRSAQAERLCRERLAYAPGDLEALALLGASLHAQGRAAEARVIFNELVVLQPQQPLHWMNLGTTLRLERRFEESLQAFQRAAALGDRSANFYFNVGLLHIDRRDFEAARAVLEHALRLAPQDAAIRVQYARALQERMRSADALKALKGWESCEGLGTEECAQIASLLLNLGEPQAAAAALAQARLDPDPPPAAAIKIIEILERSNLVGEARAEFERLRCSPQGAGADRAELRNLEAVLAQREGDHELARSALTEVLEQCPAVHLRQYYLFRLARSLDALGRYEEAFAALRQGHHSQGEHFKLTQPEIALGGPAPMRITEHPCDAQDVAAWDHTGAPAVTDSPVFVVGFPRSGTTLLELALDAHPGLRSMDEQPYLQLALEELLRQGVRYPAGLHALTPAQLAQARKVYWTHVGRRIELAPGERLIDKNPLNILRLAVIRRLFPAAPILLAIRHPCDVLLSCFMQHFGDADFALLCRDLPTLAAGYRRMFDFWYLQAQILGVAAHEVHYEALVGDFEGGIRAICAVLEVPFDANMLEPQRHASAKAFISTPSYSQVVKPVHSRSVNRWHHYRAHFTEALPLLAPYLERWNYGR